MSFINQEVLRSSKVFTRDGKSYLWTRVGIEPGAKRQPLHLIVGLDCSGSMSELIGSTPELQRLRLTRMDIVKFTTRVLASMLQPEDSMSIVKFNDTAQIVQYPISMTEAGKQTISQLLNGITAGGSTNIYDCISKAASIRDMKGMEDKHIVCAMLTDGAENCSPRIGTIQQYAIDPVVNPWSLHVFGFGNGSDSNLLLGLAEPKGLYGFISDGSLVGSVMLNFLATQLTTGNTGIQIPYKVDGGPVQVIDTGSIQIGQERDFIVPINTTSGAVTVTVNGAPVPFTEDVPEIILAREDLIHAIGYSMTEKSQSFIRDFYKKYSATTDPLVKKLVSDSNPGGVGQEGQVHMAFVYLQEWGLHYLRSYRRALELQVRLNFKDGASNIYGGEMFKDLLEEGDRLFATLAPPTPTGSYYDSSMPYTPTYSIALATMSQLNDPAGGCFAAGAKVLMADGTQKEIQLLTKADVVWTPAGPANVVALVECGRYSYAQTMCNVNGTRVTPYHPCRSKNSTIWFRPIDMYSYTECFMQTVYNLVLSSGHVIDIGGLEYVTLGHGFDDDVVKHSYFGTNRILDDLKKRPGWESGKVVYVNLKVRKNSVTGDIDGWFDAP